MEVTAYHDHLPHAAPDAIVEMTPFLSHGSWTEAVVGEREALFDWLTVNSALRLPFLSALEETTSVSTATVGALDLGGASTQIAFPAAAGAAAEVSTEGEAARTAGARPDLVATSHLGYGVLEAFQNATLICAHAALPGGDANGGRAACPCLNPGQEFSTRDGSVVVGTGGFEQCRTQVARSFVATAAASPEAAASWKKRVPGPETVFFALDFYATVVMMMGLSTGTGVATSKFAAELLAGGEALCSRPWAEHEELLKGQHQLSSTKVSRACFGAVYIVELLRAYGIMDVDQPDHRPDGRMPRVLFADTLAEFEGSWALGSLVDRLAANGPGSIAAEVCGAISRDGEALPQGCE